MLLLGTSTMFFLFGETEKEILFEEGETNWTVDVTKEQSIWSSYIEKEGPKEAYSRLKEKYKNDDLDTQHIMGHLFGEILYSKKIKESLSICDKYFGYGCYHGFTVRFIVENGLNSIKEMDALCRKIEGLADGQCQHGIGHGLVEYFGAYTPEKMQKTIETCDELTNSKGIYSECIIGAFMAYRETLSLDGDEFKVSFRGFDPQSPYSPCIESPARARGMCYAGLGLWLDIVFKQNYEKAGKYCYGVPIKEDRDLCYFGVGLFAATRSEYNVESTIEKCEQMPKNGKTMCFIGAYRSGKAFTEREVEYMAICEHLKYKEKKICIETEPYILYERAAKITP